MIFKSIQLIHQKSNPQNYGELHFSEGFSFLRVITQQEKIMQYKLFSAEQTNGSIWYKFKMSSWGRLREVLPLEQLGSCLPQPKNTCGRKEYFDNSGKFALMFLKHEMGVSDEKLIEHINHNISLQLFCGMRLGDLELIRDTGIVSRIRGFIGHHADLEKVQHILIENWKEDIECPHFLKMDATCFESYIRYPTDVKLLWECCEWVYAKQLFTLRKQVKVALGKQKERFDTQKTRYLAYSKLKRKAHKKTRKRIKSLLNLLKRGIAALQELLNNYFKSRLEKEFYQTLKTIRQIYQQQYYLFHHPGSKVKDRIVSLHKPYIRPIKRGKENKPTEFGAKVHMLQVGGISIIEYFSYNAFNECKRLKTSVWMHKNTFGDCNQVSGDRIYATNENRRFCAKYQIFHSFDAKGRKPEKSIRQLKAALNKDRATRLEGSFGNQKNHYGLDKVKARSSLNEKVWIFFGVLTANAVFVAKKRSVTSLQSMALAA